MYREYCAHMDGHANAYPAKRSAPHTHMHSERRSSGPKLAETSDEKPPSQVQSQQHESDPTHEREEPRKEWENEDTERKKEKQDSDETKERKQKRTSEGNTTHDVAETVRCGASLFSDVEQVVDVHTQLIDLIHDFEFAAVTYGYVTVCMLVCDSARVYTCVNRGAGSLCVMFHGCMRERVCVSVWVSGCMYVCVERTCISACV
jgi:hypothetical protein